MLIFSEASKDKIEIQFPGRESKTNSENVFLSLSYFYRFDNYGIGVGTKILLCNYIFGKTSSQTGVQQILSHGAVHSTRSSENRPYSPCYLTVS